jgi:hypothetical protein
MLRESAKVRQMPCFRLKRTFCWDAEIPKYLALGVNDTPELNAGVKNSPQ